MQTVSSHQTAPFSGPTAGETNRASDVLANDDALRAATNAHDGDATLHVQTSTVAQLPTAGVAGRLWYTTDTREWWEDDGAAWRPVAAISGPVRIGALEYGGALLGPAAAPGGYNGLFAVTPVIVPGSGLAKQLTRFATAVDGAGTTQHDVAVDGAFAAWGVTPPTTRATLTGSRGGATVAVLTQVVALLTAVGLATDGTTA